MSSLGQSALTKHQQALVASYVDQLLYGGEVQIRVHAAAALGRLEKLLKLDGVTVPAKVALELGVFQALSDLLTAEDEVPEVQEAAVVALSYLIAPPPGPPATKAWPQTRVAATKILLFTPVLEQLAFVVSSASSSRVVVAAARALLGLARHVHTDNQGVILSSGVIDVMISLTSGPVVRDGVVMALTLLQLALVTPELFQSVLRRSAEAAAAEAGLMSDQLHDSQEESATGGGPGAGKATQGGPMAPATALFSALCQLYVLTISPAQSSALIAPSDVASLILRAAALEPWAAHPALIAAGPAFKLILKRLLESDGLACLVSYIVVEAGNLQNVFSQVASRTAEVLDAAQRHSAAQVAVVQQQLSAIRGELGAIKAQLREAEEAGRAGEDFALALVEARSKLQAEGRALKRVLAVHSAQDALLTAGLARLQSWAGANKRHASKVRRSLPNLHVLRQTLGMLTFLAAPPAAGANKDDDAELLGLKAQVHAQLLGSGLVAAALRCAKVTEGSATLASELAGLLGGLGVAQQLAGMMGSAMALLESQLTRLRGVANRLRLRRKAVAEESGRVRKALTYNTAQGTPTNHIQLTENNTLSPGVWAGDLEERATQLAAEAQELSLAAADVQDLITQVQQHGTEASLQLQALDEAGKRAARLLPAGAPASQNSSAAAAAGEGPTSPKPTVPVPASVIALPLPKVLNTEDPLSPATGGTTAPSQQSGQLSDPSGSAAQHGTQPASQLVPLLAVLVRDIAEPPAALATLERLLLGLGPGETAPPLGSVGPSVAAAGGSPPTRPTSASPSPGRVNRPTSPAAAGRLGSPARPASASPRQGGAPSPAVLFGSSAAEAEKRKRLAAFPSNYLAIAHTNSPMRGCPPKGLGLQGPTPPAPAVGSPGGAVSPRKADEGADGDPLLAQLLGLGLGPSIGKLGPLEEAQVVTEAVRGSALLCEAQALAEPAPLQPEQAVPGAGGVQVGAGPQQAGAQGQGSGRGGIPQGGVSAVQGGAAVQGSGTAKGRPLAAGTGGVGSPATLSSLPSANALGDEEQAPPLVIQALTKQVSDLALVLNCLSDIGACCTALTRQARLLPASGLSYASMDPTALLGSIAELMAAWAAAIEARPSDSRQIAQAVAEVAAQGVTEQDDYGEVYLTSGIVAALIRLLDGRRRQSSGSAKGAGGGGGSDVEDGRSPSPAKSPGSSPAGHKHKLQSRYDLAPPVMRPSVKTTAEQQAACGALIAIGRSHPEVFSAVVADEVAMSSLTDLVTDHSTSPNARFAAARMLAALLLADTGSEGQGRGVGAGPSVVEGALRAGAFTALLELMDTDHRQGSGGAKEAVVMALASVAGSEGHRSVIAELALAAPHSSPSHGGSHGGVRRSSGGGAGASPRGAAGAGSVSPRKAATLSAVPLTSTDDVLRAVLRALWGVPNQMYLLMGSDRTKRGRYVDPQVIAPLNALSIVAVRQLSVLADEEPEARRIMSKELGIAPKINIVFLQAIKDPVLHGVLLELKSHLQS